jgi:hydrogenase maturation protein HypF
MSNLTAQPLMDRHLEITVHGIVQGVGFRPFVYNAARARNLSGWVCNEADTVRIEVQGDVPALDAFLDDLWHAHPLQARVESVEINETPLETGAIKTFQIRASDSTAAPRPTIPADLATCAQCLDEVRDPSANRFRYPFTNCTHCGPRWSIIEQLPYDRPRTSMADFSMCPTCQAEYDNPADRRFHAQPIACPKCGPMLSLLDSAGRELALGDDALRMTVAAVLAGRIVAIKGLGGFQLLVDATSSEAVARLRQRKQRPDRPFAVMLPSLAEVRRRCKVSETETQMLCGPQSPIVLLRRRCDREALGDIAKNVAPRNPYLGVMLPYTPLHHLLMAEVLCPIVCTSGNLSDEPMATTTEDALQRLGPIADVLLTHNRPIVRPVDDSIVRVGPAGPQVLRRARGYAPLPIELGGGLSQFSSGKNGTVPLSSPTILAVGGHLKNTVALSLAPSSQVVISQHIGDLDSLLGVEVFHRTIDDLLAFFHVRPEVVACDLHPDYASTRHAEKLAAGWGVPLVRVQHHHAHAAACIAEHHLQGPVLGLTWDGTGYGTDGTVWGGEALVCEGAGFTRVARLRTFGLPGGDRAVHEPRRSALGLLYEIWGNRASHYAGDWFTSSELDPLMLMLEHKVRSPRTSSMGRLFDAVAAICGLEKVVTYEGQAAMALEYAVYPCEDDAYPLLLSDDVPMVVDWEPMIRAITADRAAGESLGHISARFHNTLAQAAAAIARCSGCSQVVLSGGCFQNALLTERVRLRLQESGFNVYLHHLVPPGDGGIALGQVNVAGKRLGMRD